MWNRSPPSGSTRSSGWRRRSTATRSGTPTTWSRRRSTPSAGTPRRSGGATSCSSPTTPARSGPSTPWTTPPTPSYTLSFDLLFRGLEVTTGGQRIHDYAAQVAKMEARGMDPAEFESYLMIHKYGMPPHGGLGLGLERLTMQLCGLDNIRRACLFPRDRDPSGTVRRKTNENYRRNGRLYLRALPPPAASGGEDGHDCPAGAALWPIWMYSTAWTPPPWSP